MLKFLWQYSLLIQIILKFVCFYYPYLQNPQIFKPRAATEGEVKHIASCNILAVNNNPLKDFLQRFLFCHEVNQL